MAATETPARVGTYDAQTVTGDAEGGTVYYALGMDATAPDESAYSTCFTD